MNLIKGTDAIRKAVDSCIRRSTKLDQDIHQAACSILAHVNEHHEVSLVNRLCDGLGKGIRGNALKEWFVKFAKVEWDADAKQFIPKRDDGENYPLAPAIEMPWYECKPEPEFAVPASPADVLKKSLKQNEKALKRENLTAEDKAAIEANILGITVALNALEAPVA